MKTKTRWLCWTVLYLVIAYSFGTFAVMVAGGGHGNLTPLGISFLLTLPASLTIVVLDLIQAHYRQGSDAFGHIQRAMDYFCYFAPLINTGLIWLIAWGVRSIRGQKK